MTLQESAAFEALMAIRARPPVARAEVSVSGSDPFFRSPFRIGESAAAALAAIGVAVNDIWDMRGHARQRVSVSLSEAAATLRAVDYTCQRGEDGAYRPVPLPPERAHVMRLCRPYRTRDGHWFMPHFSLGLGARVQEVLGCADAVEAIGEAVARWDAQALEEAIAEAGACGGVIRTREQWLAHPHGALLAGQPAVRLSRAGAAEPEAFHPGERPLSGVRVLDLTRIIAGPMSSRGLAEHGADVLMVTSRDLPQAPEHVRDTSQGKRSCFLDLKTRDGAARFAGLVKDADVVVNSYRPGALEALGFGMDELARLRPGIIRVDVSCYGSGGPFSGRRGWEQIAQAVTGISHAQGAAMGADAPQIVTPLVCDFTTGYLAAYGALLALGRRAREGGSWQVEASLCRSAMFVQELGLLDDAQDRVADAPGVLTAQQLASRHVRVRGACGDLMMLGPVLDLSETPPYWGRPLPSLGGDAPAWLPR